MICLRSETFDCDPAGENPVRQRLTNGRKRVLRGGGRPSPRSVDSESESHVIELRKISFARAFVLHLAGAARLLRIQANRLSGLEQASRRSRRACANGPWGSPRNLGDPVVSTVIPGRSPGDQLQAAIRRAGRWREEQRTRTVVSRSEGNEATREERREVGAS